MKILLSYDSNILQQRLYSLVTGISGVEIVAGVENLDEMMLQARLQNPKIVIIAFESSDQLISSKLKDVKGTEMHPIIILFGNKLSREYRTYWKQAGVDYVFDNLNELHKVVNILCKVLYEQQLFLMLSNSDKKNKQLPSPPSVGFKKSEFSKQNYVG